MSGEMTKAQEDATRFLLGYIAEAQGDRAKLEATKETSAWSWKQTELRKAGISEAQERIESGGALLAVLRRGTRSQAELEAELAKLAETFRAAAAAWREANDAADLWRRLERIGSLPAVLVLAEPLGPEDEVDEEKALELEKEEDLEAREKAGVLPPRDDAAAADELGLKLETDA